MHENYCGFSIVENNHFDTEIVSKIIFDTKRGKAVDTGCFIMCRRFAI